MALERYLGTDIRPRVASFQSPKMVEGIRRRVVESNAVLGPAHGMDLLSQGWRSKTSRCCVAMALGAVCL